MRLIERRSFDNLIRELLARIVDTKDTIHMMTFKVLVSWALIAPDTGFMRCISQKVLGKFKFSATTNAFVETGSENNGRCLVAVSAEQKAMSSAPRSRNTSSDDEAEDCKACHKCK